MLQNVAESRGPEADSAHPVDPSVSGIVQASQQLVFALYKRSKKHIYLTFFSNFLGSREAALAADLTAAFLGIALQCPRCLLIVAASVANKIKNNFVIQSAASVASLRGGCASSRLDDGLKSFVI